MYTNRDFSKMFLEKIVKKFEFAFFLSLAKIWLNSQVFL